MKEITCLYEIRRGLGQELSIDRACQQVFEHLLPAMQFPELASGVIELGGRRFVSANHSERRTHELRSEINVNNKSRGCLRVFYPDDKPFLVPEEQRLIDAVSTDLERWLERKLLEQTLVSIAEEHQRTLGQELHDNLGQQIAAIGYQAKALEKKITASGSSDVATIAAAIAAQAQTAVMQCKQLAQGLLPFELETKGLSAALQAFASRIAATYKIPFDFVCKNDVVINDNNVALNLYRIAQEAANNAIRHGETQHLRILAGVGAWRPPHVHHRQWTGVRCGKTRADPGYGNQDHEIPGAAARRDAAFPAATRGRRRSATGNADGLIWQLLKQK